MGLEERVAESCINGHKADCAWTVSVHTFSDITNISPVVFLYLLKECYIHGTCKATRKFRALQQQVSQALCNSPEPGPATFIVRCLNVLPIFGVYSEGFSHLIISALRRHQKTTVNSADSTQAKEIAAYLFLDITGGFVDHDEKLMVKILEAFDVRLTDIEKAITQLKAQNEHSLLKRLAEKACWDIAEAKTKGDKRLLEYLVSSLGLYTKLNFLNFKVYLAMEAGYSEKVDELCERYSLEGFLKTREPEAGFVHSRFLHLKEVVVEDIIWVDEVDGLHKAICHIEGCKVVGIDCEWKPNYVKGCKMNKVSIMQIASDEMVFIFDLIKLAEDVPDVLDSCLTRILQSPGILKLGYNFQCDIKQLAHSYGELECFKHYEMLLDIQNVFKEPKGGLSGLAELEYAALDAVVLLQIFHHVRSCSQPTDVSEGHDKIEWKSYIVSHMDNPKKSKKRPTIKKETESGANYH
ncbi:hypothetical protein WN943_007888 [Citrus x changshan-huyou]